ncbi:MAG: Sugar transferase [Parcubacteria group bacterium Gr01-1014_3]|nr:MAG: Sugar transferase [Parcubacteria group bacterium Gr01-1014_3]
MDSVTRLKQVTLLLGDIVLLYISLLLTLLVRYLSISPAILQSNVIPFSIIFIFWLFPIYISGFYDLKTLKNSIFFVKKVAILIATNSLISVLLFYLFPIFGITPRINLFIFIVIFGSCFYLWRRFYNNLLTTERPATKVLLVGYNQTTQELVDYIGQNPQFGFEVNFWMKEGLQDKEIKHLSQIILDNRINLIVVPAHIKQSSKAAKLVYKNLALGIEVWDLARLYEAVFKKIPLAELEEMWFLDNVAKSTTIYEMLRRPVEILFVASLAALLVPLTAIVALIIKLTSKGPVIFSQTRVGRSGKIFDLYKFRSMPVDAEKNGPQWAGANDNRATFFGKILRKTHLDELPQLYNILRGDISLVGPRPERPEFVEKLKKDVPFYELRLIVRPGITGWAQINYKYGASVEDTYEKVEYDMFYLKNRSLLLDFLIILRTVKYFFLTIR